MSRASIVALALAASGCAFPPFAGPPAPDGGSPTCTAACAGRCDQGACVASPEGGPCDPTGGGTACVEGTTCVSGGCVATPVTTKSYPPVLLVDELATLRTAFCGYLVRCDRWPAPLKDRCPAALFPDTPTFDSATEDIALAKRGETTYDAQAAGDCLGALVTLDCRAAPPAACDRVFTGALSAGATCTATAACDSDFYCQFGDPISGLQCLGTCTARAKAGEDCSATPCATGLSCASDHRCALNAPPATDNQTCGPGPRPCGLGLYCAPSGTCEALHQVNESCDDPAGCAPGLACAGVAGAEICLPRRQRGEPCQSDQQCTPTTMELASDGCIGGKCAALPSSGACLVDAALPNSCDPTAASCRAGTCAPLSVDGASCSASPDCGAPLGPEICSFGSCHLPVSCETGG